MYTTDDFGSGAASMISGRGRPNPALPVVEGEDEKIPLATLKVGQTLQGTVHSILRGKGVFVDVGATHLGFLHAAEYHDGFPANSSALVPGDRVVVRALAREGTQLHVTRRSGSLERPIFDRMWKSVNVAPLAQMPLTLPFSGEVVQMTFNSITVRLSPKRLLHEVQKASKAGIEVGSELPAALREATDGILATVNRDEFYPGFEETARLGDTVQLRMKSIGCLRNVLELSMRNVGAPSIAELKVGETLTAVVRSRISKGVRVDVGRMEDGLLPVEEMRDGFPDEDDPAFAKGSNITVRVLSVIGGNLYVTRRSGSLMRPSFLGSYTGDVAEFNDTRFKDEWFAGTAVQITKSGVYFEVAAPSGSGNVKAFVHRDDFEPSFFDEANLGVIAALRLKRVDSILQMTMRQDSDGEAREEPQAVSASPGAGAADASVDGVTEKLPLGTDAEALPDTAPLEATGAAGAVSS